MRFELAQTIYYIVALATLVFMMHRYRKNWFLVLILLLAFNGPICYFIPSGAQLLRVVTALLATGVLIQTHAFKYAMRLRIPVLLFCCLSLYFVWDALIYTGDGIFITLSQYSKYYIPFVCWMVLNVYLRKQPTFLYTMNIFMGELILIQVLSMVLKAVLLRFSWYEGMVGFFGTPQGGGAGTAFPLVALAWVCLNSNMEIRGWKQWALVVGLLFIGIMTGKRAVVVLFPLFFILFAILVAQKKYSRSVITAIVLAPLLFYVGIRMTPTLNPENKVWGSFDLDYALNYGSDYAMGKKDAKGKTELGTGRVGADLLMWERIKDTDAYTPQSWFGYGVKRIFSSNDFAHYYDRDYNFGINHRGSMTGFVMWYLAFGLIGLILFLLYYWFYFQPVKYWRLRLVLYGLVMFDFFFYNAQSIRDPFIATLVVFVLFFSQLQYSPSGKFIGWTHPYFFNQLNNKKR